jgi:hypothetical protein
MSKPVVALGKRCEKVSEIDMDQDRNIKVNWGTFNVPTIIGMLGIFVVVFNQGGVQERVDARLDNIEASRAANLANFNARVAAIEVIVAKIPNIEYRITVNEAGILAVNARIDRVTDTVGSLRDDIAGVRTSIEVLTEQLKSGIPRKSELIPIPSLPRVQ